MADDPMDKLGDKIDLLASQMQQIQVDVASIKATSHGDMESVKLRLTSLETWRDTTGRTITGAIVGFVFTILAGLLMLLVQGKFHV